jgi:hypothetical protein
MTAHALTDPPEGSENPHFDQMTDFSPAALWWKRRSAHQRGLSHRVWPALIPDPSVALQMAGQAVTSIKYYEQFDDRGFVASRTDPVDPKRALKPYKKTFSKARYAEARLASLTAWAKEQVGAGTRIFAVIPPVPEAMAQLEAEQGGFNALHVRRVLEAAGVVWLDVPVDDLTSYDGSHLDPVSAARFSARVAQALAERL